MTHLGKPAALAGGAAAGSAVASNRKSTDVPKVEEPTRTISSDSEEDAAAKKRKSRSVSRNKRTSIFGKLLEKKDEHEIKKDIKKEDKAEAKEEKKEEKEEAKEEKVAAAATEGETAAVVAPLDAEAIGEITFTPFFCRTLTNLSGIASRVHDAPVETAEPTIATEATSAPLVEKTDKPRPTKRNSLFGSFFEKVRSPATEKKESEVGPIVPPKDTIVSAEAPQIPGPTTETTIESPATAEPVVEAPATTVPETEAAKIETPAASSTLTPRKEKESFFGGMMNKVRAKSPANLNRSAKTEPPAVPPKTEESVVASTTEEPVVAATTAEEPAAVEPVAATTTEEPIVDATNRPKENRRRSFFGGLSTKAEGLFRKPSQAQHSKEVKKEENVTPSTLEKSEEQAATEPTATEEVATEAPATETAARETEQPHSIGDVPAEAITVGQAHSSSNPTVSAAA